MLSLGADRRDIAAGARASAPRLAGTVPFRLVIGVRRNPGRHAGLVDHDRPAAELKYPRPI